MQCGKCKFMVPTNMRFCLMKNLCPSCGSALFSNNDMNHLSLLQNRIMKNDFAAKMDQIQVYDLALFIYNEINSGYGRTIIDEEVKKITKSPSAISDAEVELKHDGDTADKKVAEVDMISSVKEEIERELRDKIKANLVDDDSGIEMGRVNEDDYNQADYDDEDDKVARLKRQAQLMNKNKAGVSVRRL